MNQIKGGVCAAKGFTANGVHCGIRKNKTKRDLALIYSETPAAAAAVYTTNLVKGAPIAVTKKNIANGVAQAVICNSGMGETLLKVEVKGDSLEVICLRKDGSELFRHRIHKPQK